MTARPTEKAGGRWLRHSTVVLVKEMRDHLRDRRSLLLGLVYPLLGPALLGGLLTFASTNFQRQAGAQLTVAAVGAEHAPGLVEFFKKNGVTMKPAPANPRAAVRTGKEPLVLIIPPEAAGRDRFTVRMLIDLNRMANASSTVTVMELLNAFSKRTARRLMEARKLDPGIVQPIVIEHINVAHKPNIASFFYNMITPLVMFMVFLGGAHIAVDLTAGERERGSLEPLLSAPVERWELLLGKSVAAFLFTLFSMIVSFAAFRVILGAVAAGSSNLAPPPDTRVFIDMFVVAVPLMVLAVTMQIAIASVSRSMKEAQIYLGLLPVIPALPGVAMAFSPPGAHAWMAAAPGFGQMAMFSHLISGQQVDPSHLALSAITTTALAIAFFMWSVQLFKREKIFLLG
jgi:sodium transport system permease protein